MKVSRQSEDDLTIRQRLDGVETAWGAASSLLRFWLDSAQKLPPRDRDDATRDAADELAQSVVETIGVSGNEELKAPLLDTLASLPSSLEAVERAHALATGIDEARWASFSRTWMRGHDEEVSLLPDELFPVGDTCIAVEGGLSARPWRLGMKACELPHIRRSESTPFDIVIDTRWGPYIDGLMGRKLTFIAMLPNESMDEYLLPALGPLFGVSPRDGEAQARAVELLCDGALSSADIVVFPELCVTGEILDGLQELLDGIRSETLIIAAGSMHLEDLTRGRQNVAQTLIPHADMSLTHRKFTNFVDREGRSEGLDISDRPLLRILTGNHVRVASVICKDFVAPGVAEQLGELGVHVVLVPAMSERLDDFGPPTGALLSRSQGVVVVANGPRIWSGEVPYHALLGQPTKDVRRHLEVSKPTEPAPGWSSASPGGSWTYRGSSPTERIVRDY